MRSLEKPQLSWIDIDRVIDFAVLRFTKSAQKVREQDVTHLRVEPTLAAMRAGLSGTSLADSDDIDLAVSLTKTIQNAVGLFHQDILGAVAGWESSGTSGGLVDLTGYSPVLKRNIVAELKMRYNTIKASDEKQVWDQLKSATALQRDSVGYVFQIVPKNVEPYDRPWSVSGRNVVPQVRCADGVTAYHLVTGKPEALCELLRAMPFVSACVAETVLGDAKHAQGAFENSLHVYERLISESLPPRSAVLES